jgi:hypothetical protein
MFFNYQCIPFPSISLDNGGYTVVPTIVFESTKGPSEVPRAYKPLNLALESIIIKRAHFKQCHEIGSAKLFLRL